MTDQPKGALSGLDAYDAIIQNAADAIEHSLAMQLVNAASAPRHRVSTISVHNDAAREVAFAIKQALELKK